jgi:hypothetical protein
VTIHSIPGAQISTPPLDAENPGMVVEGENNPAGMTKPFALGGISAMLGGSSIPKAAR